MLQKKIRLQKTEVIFAKRNLTCEGPNVLYATTLETAIAQAHIQEYSCGNNNDGINETTYSMTYDVSIHSANKAAQLSDQFALFSHHTRIFILSLKEAYYEKKQMLKEDVGKTSIF
jgi:hypothetical protein